MPKKKSAKLPRPAACYSMDAQLKVRLDAVRNEHPQYRRLRSDMLDSGVATMIKLVEEYGPDWFYQNREALPQAIINNFEKMAH